jgi:hypothetical protein
VIYVDTSVVLAELLAEDRSPPARLWETDVVSSRLLEYELWTRVNARKLSSTHGDAARAIVARIALLDLSPVVLGRALEPFPTTVRTLDALHLASMDYLRGRGRTVVLASYDARFVAAARALDFPLFE